MDILFIHLSDPGQPVDATYEKAYERNVGSVPRYGRFDLLPDSAGTCNGAPLRREKAGRKYGGTVCDRVISVLPFVSVAVFAGVLGTALVIPADAAGHASHNVVVTNTPLR